MPKKKSSGLEDLSRFFVSMPWWVGPVFMLVVFLLLNNVAPPLVQYLRTGEGTTPTEQVGKGMLTVLGPLPSKIAPWAAGLVGFVWVCSMVLKLKRRALLENTRDLEALRAMSWQDFEHLVGEHYRRCGFSVEERGGASPDGGIDLVIAKAGQRFFVQCKHWKVFKVGVRPIREFFGVVTAGGATRGVFISSGVYTNEAVQFAKQNRVELIDGETLLKMLALVQKPDQNTPVTPIPSPQPQQMSATRTTDTPSCPVCSGPMVLRTARTGPNAGKNFYGCQKYPACRGVRKCVSR